jgi:hypothetical protein
MLSFVVSTLDDEFPLLPADLRSGVLVMVPYNAAVVEEGIRQQGMVIDPAKRVALWTDVLRETAKIILVRHSPLN